MTAAEVDDLTDRADRLLGELHSVMGEMSERLTTLTAAALQRGEDLGGTGSNFPDGDQ